MFLNHWPESFEIEINLKKYDGKNFEFRPENSCNPLQNAQKSNLGVRNKAF